MEYLKEDEKFIRRCIKLSQLSLDHGDQPFGAIITMNGKIIVESLNKSKEKMPYHAEILCLMNAQETLGNDLSSCTLYTSCEPCAMCSFMIREYKIKRVVFSAHSPNRGGYRNGTFFKIKIYPQSLHSQILQK
jgi:tRNA(adenine34) deaminase